MKQGFSIIELMIVFLIGAILASTVIPLLFKRRTEPMKEFTARLNVITQSGAQAAIESGAVQKITLNMSAHRLELAQAPFTSVRKKSAIPSEIELKEMYINGKNAARGGSLTNAYFLISPDGTSQQVRLVVGERKNPSQPAVGRTELSLNPFTNKFVRS